MGVRPPFARPQERNYLRTQRLQAEPIEEAWWDPTQLQTYWILTLPLVTDTGYTLLTPDQLKKNQKADPEYLFDVVIDCSGFPPAVEHAVSLLQRGGKLCCFGVAPPHGRITISPFDIYMKELTIHGVNINPFSFPKSIGLLEAMGDRYLNYGNLGIKTFSLSQYKEAIQCLHKGEIAKAIFKL